MLGFWTAFKVAIAVCFAYAMIPFMIIGVILLLVALFFGGVYVLDILDRMWRYCTRGKEYRARRREIKQRRKKRW